MTHVAETNPVLVRMRGITKRFGSVTVLDGVSLEIRAGEVLILAGENGAGKSTLIKILGGIHTDFDGSIEISGRKVAPASPLEAARLGISVIFQELSLVPSMSVADNIFIERPVTRYGFVDDRLQCQRAKELLDQLGIAIDVNALVEDLPISQQQLAEIAKALARQQAASTEAKTQGVIIMDEPTSALNAPEVEKLFGLIASLKSRGCGIVYITHKMEEIERIADRITVLRDGRYVGSAPASELPSDRLIEWMVGTSSELCRSRREETHTDSVPDDQSLLTSTPTTEPRLVIRDFSVHPRAHTLPLVDHVTLAVRAGEILGVAGLQGSGNSDLFLGLFGAHGRSISGEASLNGRPLTIRSPRSAIRQGMAMLTNDRKSTGLVLSLSVTANATLADLRRLCRAGWRSPRRERDVTRTHVRTLSIAASSLDLEVSALSGGNQQKVALAKWLQTDPQVLLLDEPTRGVDIGAKREIYRLIGELTKRGIAILLITSELPELLALSDRIVVMHRGRITAEFTRESATGNRVLEAAMGKVQA